MSNANIQSLPQSVIAPKSLGGSYHQQTPQNHAKALGADPALAQWYQDAYAYYQSVASGQAPQPDAAAWNDLLTQMNWAYQKLNASAGAGSMDMLPGLGAQEESQAMDPFGGIQGANGNWIHNNAEAGFGFLGGYNRDVWSNEITYDIAPMSAQTKIVKTMDNSVQPPAEVIKIKTTDPATGLEEVVTIHDWEDADITIRAGDPSAVSGAAELGITVEEFKEEGDAPTTPQASIKGEAHEELENYRIYEGRVGETIEFRPEPNGDGEVEYYEIYGDFRIVTRASDHIVVSQGMPEDPDGYTIEVRHRDGSKDIFYVNKGGFEGEIAGNPAYITWANETMAAEDIEAGVYEGVEEDVPAEYEETFTLRVPGESSEEDSNDEVNFGGTPPDDIEEVEYEFSGETGTHRTAIYNNPANRDVSINVNHDDDVTVHRVYAPGEVTINPESYQDEIRVEPFEDGYKVFVSKDGTSEIIYVTGAEKITINGLEDNIDLSALDEDDEVVAMGSSGTTRATEEPEDAEVELPEYPENVSAMVGSGYHGGHGRQLAEKVELALNSGDWSDVESFLAGIGNGTGNDMVRHYISALLRAITGERDVRRVNDSDRDTLKQVLQHLPTDVRQTMVNFLYHEESERHGDQIWNSMQTRQILVSSITEQEFTETSGDADED